MNNITLFGWKRTYYHKFIFDKIPKVMFVTGIGENTNISILNSKYGFIMERQLRLLEKYNIPNGYIFKIYHLLKYNNKLPRKITIKNPFKQIVKYGNRMKVYPFKEDGKGYYHFYKFVFDVDVLNNINTIPNFNNVIKELQNTDIENDVDDYVTQMIKTTSQTINSESTFK